jgi:hypothetical protein
MSYAGGMRKEIYFWINQAEGFLQTSLGDKVCIPGRYSDLYSDEK